MRRSGLARRRSWVTATVNGTATAQQRHPPATSLTTTPPASASASEAFVLESPAAVSNMAPSIPRVPNSFTTMPHRSCEGRCDMRWRIAVVLPTPRTPVMMLTGIVIGKEPTADTDRTVACPVVCSAAVNS